MSIHERSNDWWLLVLRGIAALILGLAALLWPGLTLAALVFVFGLYAIVDGIAALITAFRHRSDHGMWHFAQGLLSMAIGFIALVAPALAALALVVLLAAWSILIGVSEIALAIRLRDRITGEWLWALAGLLSVIFGVVIVAFPQAGLLATAWLIGIYALMLGVIWVFLGFSLRALLGRSALT